MCYRGRDVEVVSINENQYIVTACDSCGAIGSKELDVVKVPPYVSGRLTARVALMEVMSTGATPITLSAAISNEPSPTGDEFIKGIIDELKSINIETLPMAISTEKNVETRQTALGITIVGICDKKDLRIAKSRPGNIVYCVGIPKWGNEIEGVEDGEIIKGYTINELLKIKGIYDIIPVGSKGILGEAEILASSINCKFIFESEEKIDIIKSAGPSTCAIFTCIEDIKLENTIIAPVTRIGRLESY